MIGSDYLKQHEPEQQQDRSQAYTSRSNMFEITTAGDNTLSELTPYLEFERSSGFALEDCCWPKPSRWTIIFKRSSAPKPNMYGNHSRVLRGHQLPTLWSSSRDPNQNLSRVTIQPSEILKGGAALNQTCPAISHCPSCSMSTLTKG